MGYIQLLFRERQRRTVSTQRPEPKRIKAPGSGTPVAEMLSIPASLVTENLTSPRLVQFSVTNVAVVRPLNVADNTPPPRTSPVRVALITPVPIVLGPIRRLLRLKGVGPVIVITF